MVAEIVVAVVVALVQGVFEWLPVSSEGNVAIVLSAFGYESAAAVQFALFLHAGTAVSATAYYRDELADAAGTALDWWNGTATDRETATVAFLVVATVTSGVVALAAYSGLEAVVSELAGGAFVTVVGILLVATGLVQLRAEGAAVERRASPDLVDAVLVGVLQGLAILPGVSRSGTTVSALLLRGHPGEESLRLSFLLSVPAALGAGLLAVLDAGGVPSTSPVAALVATVLAALVGYLTIDALVRVVREVPFWSVCVGLGSLAVAGGALVAVL